MCEVVVVPEYVLPIGFRRVKRPYLSLVLVETTATLTVKSVAVDHLTAYQAMRGASDHFHDLN